MKKEIIISSVILIIAFIAIFCGCRKERGNNEYPDVTASEYTISGILKYKYVLLPSGRDTVVNWKFGVSTIKVYYSDSVVIASANVNADGTFQFILPATVSGIFFNSLAGLADQQGGSVKAVPETVRLMKSAQFKVNYIENTLAKSMVINLFKLKTDFSADKSYHYNFYDSDGILTGTGATGNIFNWTFTKGWGLIESYIITPGFAPYNSKSVSNTAPGSVWVNI